MKKLFYLSTCSTCKRIMGELSPALDDFDQQDIKTENITAEQLDQMHARSGSYESLFSRKAMKFRSMGLADQDLLEADYRQLILDEYTFLKRPVFILDDKIFIGSAKAEVERLTRLLEDLSD